MPVVRDGFQNERPVFQQPVRFRAAMPEMFLRQMMKFPLHIDRADGFAVLEAYHPLLARIAGNVTRALHRVDQDKVSRQTAFLKQR